MPRLSNNSSKRSPSVSEAMLQLRPAYPTPLDFDEWLEGLVESESLMSPLASTERGDDRNKQNKPSNNTKPNPPRGKPAVFSGMLPTPVAKKCVSCENGHDIVKCTTFLALSFEDRPRLLKEKGACFKCLTVGHNARNC